MLAAGLVASLQGIILAGKGITRAAGKGQHF